MRHILVAMSEVQHHGLEDGRTIAFRHHAGNGPAIVFLPGYLSEMEGSKATTLFAWAVETGRECLLLDYSGCGASGGDFVEGTLSRWRDEVLALVQERVSADSLVLVGSSMGGWLMLLAGQALDERLAGLVGIAAAPDFTDWGYDELQKAQLRAGEVVFEENAYGPDPTPTYPGFWTDGEKQRVLGGEIPINCPVRLLHGQNDADVPPRISLDLAAALRSSDVQVTLVKGGDHRLSRDSDMALLLQTVSALGTSG